MNKKLEVKDLVNAAIFGIVYFVGVFIAGMPFGFSVTAFTAAPFFVSFISAGIAIFFSAKTQNPFAFFIFAAIPGSLSALMGGTAVLLLYSLTIAALAEAAHKIFGYNTVKGSVAGYAVMSMWTAGSFWQIFILKEQYYTFAEKNMGALFAEELIKLPLQIMPVIYITALAGGLLGGLLSSKPLKKHFENKEP